MNPTVKKIVIATLFAASTPPVYSVVMDSGLSLQRESEDSIGTELKEITVSLVKGNALSSARPEAATLLTRKELERLDAVSIRGISDVVPNFFMPDYGSRITSSIYVRGIGARMDQPAVGLNVDNIPCLNKDAYDFDIDDISFVEMIRGPQSTLYGRNTMAGVINITTLSPFRFHGFRGMVQLTSRMRLKTSASWYVQPTERTAWSVSGSMSSSPGEFINDFNGTRIDKERNFSMRAKYMWRNSNGIFIQNAAAAGILRQGGYPYEYKDSGKISYNDTCFYRRFTFADGLTVRRAAEDFNITSISSFQYLDDNMTLDQDFLPEDYFTLTQKKKEWSVTQDFMIRCSDARPYNWLFGLFGFFKHLDMAAPVTFKDRGIADLIEKHRNDANPYYPIKWDTRFFTLDSDFSLPTWGLAFYHESDLKISHFKLTGGVRLDYERADMSYASSCHTGYAIYKNVDGVYEPNRKVGLNVDDKGDFHRDFLTFLPKFAVTYEIGETGNNIYLNFARGYKAGGFNTQMFSDVLQQRIMRIMGVGSQYEIDDVVGYKPEQSWNYELGCHFTTSGGLLDVEAAAFCIDCRNQQLTMFPDGTTTGRIMTNAGRTRSLGGEVSIALHPVSNFTFSVNYGYTNARFRKFFNGISDYRGKALPYAPNNTLFLQALWGTKHGKWNYDIDINMRGTGKIYWNEDNTEWQRFYCLLGASATATVGNLSLQIWGKNLTGTSYRTFHFMSMGNSFFQRGRGVEAGMTIRLNI